MQERTLHIIKESRSSRCSLMIESAPISRLSAILESKDGREEIKKGLMAKFRDSSLVDIGLDILSGIGISAAAGGLVATATGIGSIAGIPISTVGLGVSVVADVINALRNAFRADYFSAILYLIFAIPGAGDLLQTPALAGKVGVKTGKLATSFILKMFPKLHLAAQAGKLKRVAEAAYKLLDMGLSKIPGLDKHASPLRRTLQAVLSGDPAEIAKAAKESGHQIAETELRATISKASKEKSAREEGEEDSSDKRVSESTIRSAARSRRVADLYKGVLY